MEQFKNQNQTTSFILNKEKMRWVFEDIKYQQLCETCNKIIIKHVYSARNQGMTCCSIECVDIKIGTL
jgi:hypothetical protein